MYQEVEEILIKLFELYYNSEEDICAHFTEKELIKRKVIQKEELDDFDELFDEGFVDVCDMDEVLEGSKELEYVLSKEAIEYLKSKSSE